MGAAPSIDRRGESSSSAKLFSSVARDEKIDPNFNMSVERSSDFDTDNAIEKIDLFSDPVKAKDFIGENLRVLFIHGGGSKVGKDMTDDPIPNYLMKKFNHFHAQNVQDTSQFEAIISRQSRAIRWFSPDLLITHSQGGPVVKHLIDKNLWRGPTLMLAPAFVPAIDNIKFICDFPVIALFGDHDEQVPLSIRDLLVEENASLPQTQFMTVVIEDDHEVTSTLVDTNNVNLEDLVLRIWQMKSKCLNYDHSSRLGSPVF